MESELSTHEIFHYTRFDNLIGILSNGFYPKYNLEFTFLSDLYNRKASLFPVPIVSFCDIPIKAIKNHSEKYGRCAIGLKKEWAEKNGLSPVIYINPNSIVADSFAAFANYAAGYSSSMLGGRDKPKVALIIGNIFKGFNHISCFIKQFEQTEDKVINVAGNPFQLKKRKYYDEREWRFVPIWNDLKDVRHMPHSDFFDLNKLNEHNKIIEKYALKFNIEDITHIIYEEISQLQTILDTLKRNFNLEPKQAKEKIEFLKLAQL